MARFPKGLKSPTHYSDVGSPAGLSDSLSSPPATPPPCSDSESELSPSLPSSPKVKAHVPRPRNAFIVFRSHFYMETKARKSDINQNTLSCEAGLVWKSLSEVEREPFKRQAEAERLMHIQMHPNYIYTPTNKAVKRAKKAKPSPSKKRQSKKKPRRSSLSLRAARRVNLKCTKLLRSLRSSAPRPSASQLSSSSSQPPPSSRDADSEMDFVPLDEITRLDLGKVSSQSGSAPDSDCSHTPPMALPEVAFASPSTFLDIPTSVKMPNNSSHPSWVYNELVSGVSDTGIHAGWNPVQTTLDAYGDRYLYDGYNEVDAYSQYISYDATDGPVLVEGAVHPIFSQDGVWSGL